MAQHDTRLQIKKSNFPRLSVDLSPACVCVCVRACVCVCVCVRRSDIPQWIGSAADPPSTACSPQPQEHQCPPRTADSGPHRHTLHPWWVRTYAVYCLCSFSGCMQHNWLVCSLYHHWLFAFAYWWVLCSLLPVGTSSPFLLLK